MKMCLIYREKNTMVFDFGIFVLNSTLLAVVALQERCGRSDVVVIVGYAVGHGLGG